MYCKNQIEDNGECTTQCEHCKKYYAPLEESKKYPIGGYAPGNYMCNCITCKQQFIGDKRAVQCESCAIETVNTKTDKQETLEEAAKQYSVENGVGGWLNSAFIAGAKWQEKQMYSEDEVLNLLYKWSTYQLNIEFDKLAGNIPNVLSYVEWFKQFKKNK